VKFRILGADNQTGENMDLIVDVANAKAASNYAQRMGILVGSIRREDGSSPLRQTPPVHGSDPAALATPMVSPAIRAVVLIGIIIVVFVGIIVAAMAYYSNRSGKSTAQKFAPTQTPVIVTTSKVEAPPPVDPTVEWVNKIAKIYATSTGPVEWDSYVKSKFVLMSDEEAHNIIVDGTGWKVLSTVKDGRKYFLVAVSEYFYIETGLYSDEKAAGLITVVFNGTTGQSVGMVRCQTKGNEEGIVIFR